jgi:hypothetical protein
VKAYKPEILLEPRKRLWIATAQMCGKRLKQALPLWLTHYEKHFDVLSQDVYELEYSHFSQLLNQSSATPRLLATNILSANRLANNPLSTTPGIILILSSSEIADVISKL